MQYEICFLDRQGRLSCLMTGKFSDQHHAARFARHAMDTAVSRGKLHSAEIHGEGQRDIVVSPDVQQKRPRPANMARRSRAWAHAPA